MNAAPSVIEHRLLYLQIFNTVIFVIIQQRMETSVVVIFPRIKVIIRKEFSDHNKSCKNQKTGKSGS